MYLVHFWARFALGSENAVAEEFVLVFKIAEKNNADCQAPVISQKFARNAKKYQLPSFMPGKMPMLSFMPSKMPIANFYAEFLEIKVLLLVLVPGTTNLNSTLTQTQQHTHTYTIYNDLKIKSMTVTKTMF